MTTVTLEQVASRAGVSAATVSRAFNRPQVVNQQTLHRVMSAANELGYVGLATRDRQTANWAAGLTVPDIANPVVMPMIKAAQLELRRENSTLMLADADETPEEEILVTRRMTEHANGMILASPRLSDEEVRHIAAMKPTVLVNRFVEGVPAVGFDEVGLVQAVEHLAGLGHQRIHYLSGPTTSRSDEVRSRVISATCAAMDLEFVTIGPTRPGYEAGARLADMVLSLKATAVIAFNDLIALGLLSALRVREVSVPNDISVIGIDDIWLDDAAAPALTSVRFPWGRAGSTSVQLLTRLLSGTRPHDIRSVTLPTELVVRSSTSPRESA